MAPSPWMKEKEGEAKEEEEEGSPLFHAADWGFDPSPLGPVAPPCRVQGGPWSSARGGATVAPANKEPPGGRPLAEEAPYAQPAAAHRAPPPVRIPGGPPPAAEAVPA